MGFATSKIKNEVEKNGDFSRFYKQLSFEQIAKTFIIFPGHY